MDLFGGEAFRFEERRDGFAGGPRGSRVLGWSRSSIRLSGVARTDGWIGGAGMARNVVMVELGADVVLGFLLDGSQPGAGRLP